MYVSEVKSTIKYVDENPLNALDIMTTLQRIDKYRKTDIRRISDNDLQYLILETLPMVPVDSWSYSEGFKFYRLRKRQQGEIYYNLSKVWYKPAKDVESMGRLNRIGETILYASTQISTAFCEMKALPNDQFALIEFEVKQSSELRLANVGLFMEPSEELYLDDRGLVNFKIIRQFLDSEFTRDVCQGTEYLYRVTNILITNIIGVQYCMGFRYGSSMITGGINVAIKPGYADNLLKINYVQNITFLEEEPEGMKYVFENQSVKIDDDGSIYYS